MPQRVPGPHRKRTMGRKKKAEQERDDIAPAELGPFPKLNPEFVVRARPWVAIGLDRDMATLGERPGWSVIPAVREQRLCSLTHPDYEMVIRPGPRLGEAAGLLAACLAGMGR